MAVVISLKDVVEAIEMQTDESETYLDPDSGEFVLVTEDDRAAVEEERPEDEIPQWQRDNLPKVREALESDRFLPLPDKRDVHEWSIMEQFARDQSGRAGEILLAAIHGKGAFRSFRAAVDRLGLKEAWFKYRADAIEQIARDWLEENNLHYK